MNIRPSRLHAHGMLGLLLGLGFWLVALPADAVCTLGKVTTVPLTVAGPRLYVPVKMNETEGQFLVDTGAEQSILTGAYAARSGVGIDWHPGQTSISGVGDRGTLRVNMAHVRHIEVGGISFQDWEFPVVPVDAGGMGKSERDGILGMDFLHYFDLDFDLQGGTLTLWRLTGCKDIHPAWKEAYDAIPLTHTAHENVTIPIMIDNAFLDVVFDTGAYGLVLSRDAASRAGLTDAMLAGDEDAKSAGMGGKFPSVKHRFKMLAVGSGEMKDPVIKVETETHRTSYGDGLIEWRYLNTKKMWISYATNTLFVEKAAK